VSTERKGLTNKERKTADNKQIEAGVENKEAEEGG
jgi:hypothetical protein